jgi:hypothetical protein
MIYNIFAFLLLGAFLWRVTPLAMDHDHWGSIVASLLLVYFWLAVLFGGMWMLYLGVKP